MIRIILLAILQLSVAIATAIWTSSCTNSEPSFIVADSNGKPGIYSYHSK